jgi:Protein kinase domain
MPFAASASSASKSQQPLPSSTSSGDGRGDARPHGKGNKNNSSSTSTSGAGSAGLSRRSKSLAADMSLAASYGGGGGAPSTPLSVLPEDGTVVEGNSVSGSGSGPFAPMGGSSQSSSPSTPPKKVWERSYKNFLKLRGSSGGGGSGGSARNLQVPASIPPPSLPHRRAQSASSTSSSQAAGPTSAAAAAASLHATLTHAQSAGTVPPSTTTTTPLSGEINNDKAEGSVRGGRLFANMFHHHHTQHQPSPMGGGGASSGNSSSSGGNARKSKSLSADELDGTLRRGAGKGAYSYSDAYSPGSNHRQVVPTTASSQQAPSNSSNRPPPTTIATTMAGPATAAVAAVAIPASLRSRDGGLSSAAPALQPRSEDAYASLQLGIAHEQSSSSAVAPPPSTSPALHVRSSPRAQQRALVVQEDSTAGFLNERGGGGSHMTSAAPSTTASKSDSAMKKAFTEFHNSSSTGRDAVSAFLGDEPSHRGARNNKTGGSSNASGHSNSGNSRGGHQTGPGHSLAWTSSHHHATVASGSAMGSKMYASMVELPRVLSIDDSVLLPPPNSTLPPLAPSPGRSITTGTVDNLSISGSRNGLARVLETSDDIDAKLATFSLMSQTASESAATAVSTGSTGLVKVPSYFHVSPPVDSSHLAVGRKNVRVLKPIQSVDVWQPNRRYLIAPAALAACPLHVLPTLSPGPSKTAVQVHNQNLQKGQFCSPFGTVVLGRCWMASTPRTLALPSGGRSAVPTPPAGLTTAWSEGVLVLKQNYLLEYGPEEYHPRASPRGYAHLQFATCKDQDDDKDEFRHHVIRLEFYGSPCAKSDPRTLHIQLHDASERKAWKWGLNRAAQLTIQDLYHYHPNDATGSSVLGKGSYSTVYAACRQGEQLDGQDAADSASVPRHTCALKIFDKSLYWKMVVKGRERADTLVRETSVQATMTAKCGRISSFVRIRGFFETSDHVVLELEMLDEGTDLFKYISARGVLKEARAAEILHDMLVALQAMNRIGLAHRDVKPANVLMIPGGASKANASSTPSCKIADFGMSTFVGVDGQLRGRCGTPGFVGAYSRSLS